MTAPEKKKALGRGPRLVWQTQVIPAPGVGTRRCFPTIRFVTGRQNVSPVGVGMPGLPWVALVAALGTACTGVDRSSWPTAPSALDASSAAGPVRVEHWVLTL